MNELYNDKPGANLLALPPEILFIILSYSLEPQLIHACHRLHNVLPPFVQWTKALAGIAVCLSSPTPYPFSLYEGYKRVLDTYEADCGLPLVPSRKRDIREAVFLNTWFEPSHFRHTILSLYYAMPDDLHAFHKAKHQFGLRSAWPVTCRGTYGCSVLRLDQFSVAITHPQSAPRKQSIKIWLTDNDRIEPTAIEDVRMPGIRHSNTAEGMVLGFIWASDFQHTLSNVEQMQDGLVHWILNKCTPGVESYVRQLGNISQSGSLGSVEWKHVVLAAKHSKAEITKLLVERDAWPVWDVVKVRQLADELKSNKSEEWETKYQMLMYECRMQRSHEQYEVQQRLAGQ